MRSPLVLCLAAGACLCAQVRFSPDEIAVNIDGKPFTTFHYGGDSNKSFLAPLRSASGGKSEFRWRVVVHRGDAESGHVGELYGEYAGKRSGR